MPEAFQIDLSSGEMYVLAGFFQFQSMFGVEADTLAEWQKDLRNHVRHTVKRLEKRKLLYFEPGGLLLANDRIHQMIKCLAEPERIVLAAGNVQTGKYCTAYFFEKDGRQVRLDNLDETHYTLTMYPMRDSRPLFAGTAPPGSGLHEKMPLEEAEAIQEMLCSFQEDKAKASLEKHLMSRSSVELIAGLLSKKNHFLELLFLEKRDSFYEIEERLVLSFYAGQALKAALDENHVLHIDSFDTTQIQKEFLQRWSDMGAGER